MDMLKSNDVHSGVYVQIHVYLLQTFADFKDSAKE